MLRKVTTWAVLLVCSATPSLGAAELRVGAAAADITPAEGTPMSGFNSTRVAKGVDDDLYATAIVLERDGVRVALVACDLITMPPVIAEEARRLIAEDPGIPAGHVMLSATHTHTGPLLTGKQPTDPAAAGRTQAYMTALPGKIAGAVREAHANLAPARASAGVGHEPRLSFNRRYFMKDGTVGWNPGKFNPATEGPAGPVDPDVPVVYFESADGAPLAGGRPIATHVSFAMHPDTRHGERISADFPGQLRQILAKVKGAEMVTLFATGACGDVNHVNVNYRGGQISPRESARIGMVLAGEVLKTYGRLRRVADGPLVVRREAVALPLPTFTPEEVEQARKTLATPPAGPRVSVPHVHAAKVLDAVGRKGRPLDVEVQVVALGDDLAWVALPGEVFAELGLDLKRRSPFRQTVVVELANGSVGYVPTRRAYAEGNYEPAAARCAPGSGEHLVDVAVRLLGEAKSAAAIAPAAPAQ